MGKNNEQRLIFGGYDIRLRVRTIKVRRMKGGRARGFYAGEYVYLCWRPVWSAARETEKCLGPITPAPATGERVKRVRWSSSTSGAPDTGKTWGRIGDLIGDPAFPEEPGTDAATYNGRSERKKRG
jgi:hypothetical protein